jgi:CubicO group peptidase (beta-lactamase class C family)
MVYHSGGFMLKHIACAAALVTGLAWTGQVPAAQAPSDRAARLRAAIPDIDSLFAAFAERNHVPGIAYGILIDGSLVHTGRVGTRQLPGRSPIDDDTVFRIASMTKSFTALCILKLRDEGRLSLDDPAEKYVPELAGLKYPASDSPKLTVRHLLSHAAGFPEDNPWGDQQLAVTEAEFTDMLRRGIPFSNAPGVAYEYSNYGFAILGRIVTRVSGVKYADYVTANILKPLGMTATTLEPASVPANRIAHGYRWEDNQWKEEPPLPDGAFGAMGGMLTSTRDLGRYVGFLMSAWPARDGPDAGPVKRSSLREMQQTHRPRPATVTGGTGTAPVQLNALGYGYGLGIRQTCEYQSIVSHSGGLPGFGSQMRWLTDEGVGFIAMGNLTYTGWGGVLDQATAILARTGALTRRQPDPSPALLSAKTDVTALITKWDDALADRIAATNLFLDVDKPHRRAQLDAFASTHGTCRADGPFDVENALRGQWTMRCDRGALRVAITLAPTLPPTVQYLNVTAIPVEAGSPARVCGQ